MKQTLCRIGQVFVYRVPPMKTSVGHRAEDWNLAKPAATCSMQILQQDNTLLIQLLRNVESSPTSTTETFLFAQAKLVFDISSNTTCSTSTGKEQQQQQQKPIEYWVEPVVDSSRYFVIRCEDERTKRQAFVGIGTFDSFLPNFSIVKMGLTAILSPTSHSQRKVVYFFFFYFIKHNNLFFSRFIFPFSERLPRT